MNRYPDPSVLRERAQALRRETLSGITCEAAIKWRTLVALLTETASAAPASNAPHPCQGPTPSHS
jgi:hypothetical protein